MKRPLILATLMLCLGTTLSAQVSKTITVATPGTLGKELTADDSTTLGTLTVNGSLDSTDVAAIAKMKALAVLSMSGSTIKDGVFPDYVFMNMTSLMSITLPSTLITIDSGAFYGCKNLTSVILPPTLTSVGNWAFWGCSSLTSIDLPASVATLGVGAFYGCAKLTSMTIPPGMQSIPSLLFGSCSSLTSVTVPPTVEHVGDWAFMNCSKLPAINLPTSVRYLGKGTFINCGSITSINLPQAITSIEKFLFFGCYRLQSVVIPPLVSVIDTSGFEGCSGLSSLSIPAATTSIRGWAFKGCSNLTTITLPSQVTTIENFCFENCSKITTIYSLIAKPVPVKASTFLGVKTNIASLYVPAGTKPDYDKTPTWNAFSVIEMVPLQVSTPQLTIDPKGRQDTINITTNTPWKASSNQLWLVVNPSSGTKNSKLTLSASENNTGTIRQATITLTSLIDGTVQTIAVEQQIPVTTSADESPTTPNIYPNPASTSITVSTPGEAHVEIFSPGGTLVFSATIKGPTTLPLSLPAGNYALKLDHGDSETSQIILVK